MARVRAAGRHGLRAGCCESHGPLRAAVKAPCGLLRKPWPPPALLGVPWSRARHEQPHQEPHQHQPLPARARGPVSVTHGPPLSRHSLCRPGPMPSAATSCARPSPTEADFLCVCPLYPGDPQQRHRHGQGHGFPSPRLGTPAVDTKGSMFTFLPDERPTRGHAQGDRHDPSSRSMHDADGSRGGGGALRSLPEPGRRISPASRPASKSSILSSRLPQRRKAAGSR